MNAIRLFKSGLVDEVNGKDIATPYKKSLQLLGIEIIRATYALSFLVCRVLRRSICCFFDYVKILSRRASTRQMILRTTYRLAQPI